MGAAGDNSDFIEIEKTAGLATNNAMHVWAAYSFARAAKTPPPEWVLQYFDLCARDIFTIAMDVAKGNRRATDSGKWILKALRLKTTDLRNYHSDWLIIGMNVRCRMQQQGDKQEFAVEAVAKDAGVSKSTVARAFRLFDKAFPSGFWQISGSDGLERKTNAD
jgi:hypothetical protein